MKKRRIIMLIMSLVSVLILIVSVCGISFGWFLNVKSFGNVKLQITKINSEIYLYKGNDSNYNGIPDYLDDDAVLPDDPFPTDKYYYAEERSFSFIAKEYALSTTKQGDIDMIMDLGSLYPTQSSVFKFACINNSDMENWITFSYNSKDYDSEDDLDVLRMLSVRVCSVENMDEDGDITSTNISFNSSDKIYFNDYISGSSISAFDVIAGDDAVKIGGSLDVKNNSNCKDFWIQFEFETYDAMVAHDADFPLTEAEYQALQGKDFELPTLKLSLEIRVSD